ncbi:two component transcriptional regulator, LuxR family protein (plasmid) [Scytonema sp. HK-05]|nr:helix-turn-helix transcriptional regulator [Scytonema sp. HK-05]BAY50538.1 two component transcriptional regulator, LuxR family protein [Scytonema sp. HK-05]
MASIPLLIKDDFEYLRVPSQIDFFGDSSVNHALTAVAQEVVELLQQAYAFQTDGINHVKTNSIRVVEPEYTDIIPIEPLTARQLEVLKLIVDGHNNIMIARKLYIAVATVKAHIRKILKKLYVSDRTQAAIRALRCDLVH